MSKIKTITHIVAVAIGIAAAFFLSPKGQALVSQYPRLTAVSVAIIALGGLYHNPQAS